MAVYILLMTVDSTKRTEMWSGKTCSMILASKEAESPSFYFQPLPLPQQKKHTFCLTLNSEYLFMIALSDLCSFYKSCTFI